MNNSFDTRGVVPGLTTFPRALSPETQAFLELRQRRMEDEAAAAQMSSASVVYQPNSSQRLRALPTMDVPITSLAAAAKNEKKKKPRGAYAKQKGENELGKKRGPPKDGVKKRAPAKKNTGGKGKGGQAAGAGSKGVMGKSLGNEVIVIEDSDTDQTTPAMSRGTSYLTASHSPLDNNSASTTRSSSAGALTENTQTNNIEQFQNAMSAIGYTHTDIGNVDILTMSVKVKDKLKAGMEKMRKEEAVEVKEEIVRDGNHGDSEMGERLIKKYNIDTDNNINNNTPSEEPATPFGAILQDVNTNQMPPAQSNPTIYSALQTDLEKQIREAKLAKRRIQDKKRRDAKREAREAERARLASDAASNGTGGDENAHRTARKPRKPYTRKPKGGTGNGTTAVTPAVLQHENAVSRDVLTTATQPTLSGQPTMTTHPTINNQPTMTTQPTQPTQPPTTRKPRAKRARETIMGDTPLASSKRQKKSQPQPQVQHPQTYDPTASYRRRSSSPVFDENILDDIPASLRMLAPSSPPKGTEQQEGRAMDMLLNDNLLSSSFQQKWTYGSGSINPMLTSAPRTVEEHLHLENVLAVQKTKLHLGKVAEELEKKSVPLPMTHLTETNISFASAQPKPLRTEASEELRRKNLLADCMGRAMDAGMTYSNDVFLRDEDAVKISEWNGYTLGVAQREIRKKEENVRVYENIVKRARGEEVLGPESAKEKKMREEIEYEAFLRRGDEGLLTPEFSVEELFPGYNTPDCDRASSEMLQQFEAQDAARRKRRSPADFNDENLPPSKRLYLTPSTPSPSTPIPKIALTTPNHTQCTILNPISPNQARSTQPAIEEKLVAREYQDWIRNGDMFDLGEGRVCLESEWGEEWTERGECRMA